MYTILYTYQSIVLKDSFVNKCSHPMIMDGWIFLDGLFVQYLLIFFCGCLIAEPCVLLPPPLYFSPSTTKLLSSTIIQTLMLWEGVTDRPGVVQSAGHVSPPSRPDSGLL